jgi:hypothetical protein
MSTKMNSECEWMAAYLLPEMTLAEDSVVDLDGGSSDFSHVDGDEARAKAVVINASRRNRERASSTPRGGCGEREVIEPQ